MEQVKLNAMEIDAIGEILNISLGASATAVSIMLDARVDITTPRVSVQSRDEFEFHNIKPAICVEITYVEGLEGRNIMLLKRRDVKAIIEMLMGMDIPDEEFVLAIMSSKLDLIIDDRTICFGEVGLSGEVRGCRCYHG